MRSSEVTQSAPELIQRGIEARGVVGHGLKERRDFGVWLTAESAAEYLDFSRCQHPARAFMAWARRTRGLVCGYRGDVPIWERADLDRAVRQRHESQPTSSRRASLVRNSDKAVR